jgi:hypothetical protein
MPGLSVTVAAYGAFASAAGSWDALDRAVAEASVVLVDAALLERNDDAQVVRFHEHSAAGWGDGLIASAVVGLLSPPALLVGAVAGSVGGHTISALSRGLSRDAVSELGRAFIAGRFVVVVVTERGGAETSAALGGRSSTLASVPVSTTTLALHLAFEADAADA